MYADFRHTTPRAPKARRSRPTRPARPLCPTPAPEDPLGLAFLVDDGDRTLSYTGYRLYKERDRYLIRVWHRMIFRDLVRAYAATLDGEPRDLMWLAFSLTSWDDLAEDGSGFWGPGDRQVYQDSITPLVVAGLLLPA